MHGRLVVVALAGWLNQPQQDVVDYLQEENRVLREQLEGKRLRFTDDQRRRLAAKGKTLGSKVLREVCTLVTPETVLRWYRTLIAKKYDSSAKRGPGRPPMKESIQDLVVRMARENVSWGYGRIQGAPENLGHVVSRSTIARILKEHGIAPAPRRHKGMSWSTFLKSHWEVLAGPDLFTVEVMTLRGLVRYSGSQSEKPRGVGGQGPLIVPTRNSEEPVFVLRPSRDEGIIYMRRFCYRRPNGRRYWQIAMSLLDTGW